MSEFVEIWRKEISNYLLIEYERKSSISYCQIIYTFDDDLQFSFGGWGIDREKITEEMIWRCCQGFIDSDCDVSVSSFYDNYLCFVPDNDEEVDDI
jgi:hypothetical protein